MTRSRELAKILTDGNLTGTLDVAGAFTSIGIDDNADANAITINSSEQVGIGTTSPSSIFHLNSSSTAEVKITLQNTGGTTAIFGNNDDIIMNADKYRIRNSDGSSEYFRINSGGNVGIGTTSPENNLHIFTDAHTEGITIKSTGNTANAIIADANRSSAGNTINQLLGKWNGTSVAEINFQTGTDTTNKDDGIIAFRTSSANNISERMRIDADGNVLIGRTSLITDFGDGRTGLVLVGTGAQDYASIQIGNNGTSSNTQILGILAFYDGSNNNARVQSIRADATDSAHLLFSTRANGGSLTEAMRILSNGDVAINSTTTSTSGFSVGHLKVGTDSSKNSIIVESNRQNQVAYGVHADGSSGIRYAMYILNGAGGEVGKISYTSSATTYATTSDYRLKENISYDFDATTRLKQLKPCRFNFTMDEDNNVVDGFLAHEVSSIVPEAILGEKDATKEDGSVDPQSIDQAKLVPLLTKTLQEALTRIDALEAEVKALKS
tara:strand:- start:1600 stop:3087 length:1488 start_codon:yes stop_codon:yes gene_type:complete